MLKEDILKFCRSIQILNNYVGNGVNISPQKIEEFESSFKKLFSQAYSEIIISNTFKKDIIKNTKELLKEDISWKYINNPLTIIVDYKDGLLLILKDFVFEDNFAPLHYYLLFILSLKEWCKLDIDFLVRWKNSYYEFYKKQDSNYHLNNADFLQLFESFVNDLFMYWNKKENQDV